MSNDITIFENQQFGKIRTVSLEGEPWFVLKDVCEILGIANSRNVTARLDEDEKGVHSMDTPGGEQELTIISESGLYNAVLVSRNSEAREFKRWVTREVIPSIRKHGAYMTPVTLEAAIANPDFMIGLLQNLKEEQAKRIEAENTIKVLAPKAEFYDDVAGSRSAISIGDVAKVLGIKGLGRNNLFEALRDLEIIDRNNIPYQEFVDRGYFRVVEQKYSVPNGETKISLKTLVYQRGLDYIRKKLKEVRK